MKRERKLIREDVKEISNSIENAERANDLLGKMLNIYPFKDLAEIPYPKTMDAFLKRVAISRDKFLEELDQKTTLLEVTLTPDLIQLKELILEYHNFRKHETRFILLEGNKCRIDKKALAEYIDKFRSFAETPEQNERLLWANNLIDTLDKVNISQSHTGKFVNPMISYDITQQAFVPRVSFVKDGV